MSDEVVSILLISSMQSGLCKYLIDFKVIGDRKLLKLDFMRSGITEALDMITYPTQDLFATIF